MSQLALALIRQAKQEGWKSLDLGCTGLTDDNIPDELFELTELEELRLSNRVWNYEKKEWIRNSNNSRNFLHQIPENIVRLQNIQRLYIGGSGFISRFDDNWKISDISILKNLKKLKSLDLSYNKQIKDYSILKGMSNLQCLYLRYNKISDISILEGMNSLQFLYLSDNDISDISVLKAMNNLQYLYLDDNKISDISVLKGMNKLQSLSLNDNNISDISILEGINSLQSLSLNDNKVLDISILKHLNQLQYLDLSSNREISDISSLEKLKSLKHLNLYYNKANISSLKNLTQLEFLSLGENKISDISDLKYLENLRSLILRFNEVSDISSLKFIENLEYLDLASNKISDIQILSELKNLQSLYLGNNREIRDFSILGELKNLQYLHLKNNVRDISFLNLLKQLHTLDLSGNHRIESFSVLEQMTNLKTLGLYGTNISDISPLLHLIRRDVWANTYHFDSDMLSRNTINLNECTITTPPLEIVKEGNTAILRYFDELEDKGVDYLNEGKLLLVGEGGVGKTSLCRKLEKDDADLPEEEERTRGIDVLRLPIAGKDGTPFYMNIWDFGGQDIYHATHRFFLTRRSLYVLLTETRRQDDNFDYWIPNIHLFGGGSPILVVNNKRDGFPRQVSIGAFRKNEAFNIQGTVHEVNLKNGEGVARLKSDICHHIQQLPLVGNPVPKTWVQVREALNTLSQSTAHITYQDFEGICRDKGIDEVLKIEDLGKYLHDLGVVLWYHDIAALKHRVILQPTWATDAVYLIIDDTTIQESYGHFDGSDIARIWAAPAYVRMHSELLALMQAFRLCYQKTQREAYIIPSMLRSDADFDWAERDNVRLYYEYEFMPKGLVNQLTAELHRLIANDNQVWSRGVVLERDGTQVKVEEIRKDKRLTFHAKGLMPGALLQEVAGRLEDVHEGYPGIQVEKVVPCPCVDCKDSNEPTLFYYKKLIKWLSRGNNPITCNESQEKIYIETILGHVGIDLLNIEQTYLHHVRETQRPKLQKTVELHPLKVFFSYSKKDKELRDELDDFLTTLKYSDNIETWHDREMIAGTVWDDKIKSELRNADIVLCLVSSDFLATKYIMDEELPIMLKREQEGLTKVIPVILRPCPWEDTILAKFQALLGKDKPLTKYDNIDDAFMEIYNGLKRVIEAT